MRGLLGVTLTLLLAAHQAGAQESCPGVNVDAGYPVSVVPVGSSSLDGAALADLARVIAYRWRVPSRSRDTYRGWERVQVRQLPPEPRWADDWQPDEEHRAVTGLVIRSDGTSRMGPLEPASGDDRFDESLPSIAEEPMPGGPEWPAVGADSLVVEVHFGTAAPEGGLVRFAAQQSPVRLMRNTLRVEPRRQLPRSASATVKYDVLPGGIVEPASIEILRSSSPDLSDAIREGLRFARFEPAVSNCRPIVQSVVQTFGN